MRTAAICPTCATYENCKCVLYDGAYLANTDIEPLDSVEECIVKINAAIGVSGTSGTSGSSGTSGGLTNESLKITYTGTPQTALVFSMVPGNAIVPIVAGSGQMTYTAGNTPAIASFTYAETSALSTSGADKLTSFSFDDLVSVSGAFTPSMPSATSFQANTLTSVGGAFSPGGGLALTTLEANALTYVGGAFSPGASGLTSFQFNSLVSVGGAFQPSGMGFLTTFQCNSLVSVGGLFQPSSLTILTSLQLNSLVTVGGTFQPQTMAALTTLQCNALTYIGGSFQVSSMASLTTLECNSLEVVRGAFQPSTLALLTTLTFNTLTTIGSLLSLSNSMPSLTTVSFAGMINYESSILISSIGCPNVSSVTLGTIGTLKSISGSTITLSGLMIPSANVNDILALLVSLDGTGGTTLWGAGKTLLINGGTNGAPTGTGITDKATLIARGATVTTN